MGVQISAPNQPIGRLQNIKNTYVKNRFICTRENLDSPTVLESYNTNISPKQFFDISHIFWNFVINLIIFLEYFF